VSLSRFFIVGVGGAELEPEERELLWRHPPGGILLFARNIGSEEGLRSLAASIRETVSSALLMVDQEGGPVDRFRAIAGESISFARAASLGRAGQAGRLAGELCGLFGVDMDLAPVVDRAVPGAGSLVLRERCASEDPRTVARAGREFIGGLAEFGVASCLKHFPGLGRAAADTHVSLPLIEPDPGERERDLEPFARLRRRADAVMVSHAAVSSPELPATMDPAVATGLLRTELESRKAALSDDLEMGALAGWGPVSERAAAAFAAGCDLLVIGSGSAPLPEAVARLEAGAPPERVAEADARLRRLRARVRRLRDSGKPPRPLHEIVEEARELRWLGESLGS
jgi:beta-N-acetylhexosaminidase